MSNLTKIIIEAKCGSEEFYTNSQKMGFQLIDFWAWNQSNLFENRTRGVLAEFIVAKALNISLTTRIEWDDFDLITKNGKRIEVKSAAYVQSWKQTKYSTIQFSIGVNNRNNGQRLSDYYIFCLFKTQEDVNIDPMNLSQWVFYVLETEEIDKQLGNQKTITLRSLLKLNPTICDYQSIKNHIR